MSIISRLPKRQTIFKWLVGIMFFNLILSQLEQPKTTLLDRLACRLHIHPYSTCSGEFIPDSVYTQRNVDTSCCHRITPQAAASARRKVYAISLLLDDYFNERLLECEHCQPLMAKIDKQVDIVNEQLEKSHPFRGHYLVWDLSHGWFRQGWVYCREPSLKTEIELKTKLDRVHDRLVVTKGSDASTLGFVQGSLEAVSKILESIE
ncbi:MAG: hypothetical protein Q9159_002841 [Coniocarpon cinnabarinum]